MSLTKVIAHSSSASERFSKEAVGVMLTWLAGKCTLVIAEETGEGLKIVKAVCQLVLRHRLTDTSNTSGLLKSDSIGFSRSTRSRMGVPG